MQIDSRTVRMYIYACVGGGKTAHVKFMPLSCGDDSWHPLSLLQEIVCERVCTEYEKARGGSGGGGGRTVR